jgi:Abnormal spindle-like microcephaly-assoc'd, ASPM-SPD-2-Hydin/NHL repeat
MEEVTKTNLRRAQIAVVVAIAVWLLAPPVLAQTPIGTKSTFGLVGSGIAPILTFTPGMASTVAGTGSSGYSGDGGPATSAQFNFPMGIARDSQGNLYIADAVNNVVRKVSADGIVTTVAGNGTQGYSGDGGPATSAQLAVPTAVGVDGAGNLYIADFFNACVRKVDGNGMISTLATAAGLPVRGLAADSSGNVYYSSSYEGVWKVNAQGVITKIAGNGSPGFSGDGGPATDAQTAVVAGLTLDGQGNLYLTEVANSDVRKVDTNGIITTVAGNQQFGYAGDGGPATSAKLNSPTDVRVDAAGNLYIADSSNNRIRKVNAAGKISTIAGDGNYGYAGDGGLVSAAQFAGPAALVLDGIGNLFVADTGNSVIRKIDVETTVLDFGTVTVGQTGGPISVIVSNAGDTDLNLNGISVSSDFGLQTTCAVNSPLAPGSECSVDISFVPTVNGNITGTVTVSDDAAGNPHVINLKGVGYIAPHPDKLVFATQFPVQPLNGNLGTVVVNATDVNGNLATGFAGVVNLQIQGPAGFTPFAAQVNASGGTATFDVSAVVLSVAGPYSIQATSAGLASAQAAFTVAGNPDFDVSMSAQSLNIGKESVASINATVSPVNGFKGTINLTCSGLPLHSACSFAPASLQADGSNTALTSVVTISTGVANIAGIQQADGPMILATSTGVLSAGLLGLGFAPVRRNYSPQSHSSRLFQRILAAIILCSGLVGCQTLGGQTTATPPGSYTVKITATSAGVSHSSTFTLVVK